MEYLWVILIIPRDASPSPDVRKLHGRVARQGSCNNGEKDMNCSPLTQCIGK